ncbi:AAEL013720-PA [Aedes aegypti]|uniref:AAEL013720-PA n=1 Tax=Aedes aegypti TaxID=7159 RepID=Q16ID1_AEDAE|nr:AAEL013720-PA [Aedes aegypti]
METRSIFIAVILSITSYVKAEDYEAPRLKTLATIEQECAGYLLLSNETLRSYIAASFPKDSTVQKLVHCFLVNMNAWDDETGIKDYVIRNYFKPSDTDSSYESRTQCCLRDKVSNLDRCAVFERAYHSFICYYQNYGNLVPEAQFIPWYQVDREKNLREVFLIEGITRAQLSKFQKSEERNPKEYPILYYMDVIRNAFYDPSTGHDLGRLYTQYGIQELLADETRQCLDTVSRNFFEEPTRAYQGYDQCLRKYLTCMWKNCCRLLLRRFWNQI